jgi:hypothetical protein
VEGDMAYKPPLSRPFCNQNFTKFYMSSRVKSPGTFLLEAEIKKVIMYSVYNILRRGLLFDVRFIESIPIIINNNLNKTIMVF